MGIGHLVPCLSSFGDRDDQATPPQAGEVVGDVRSGQVKLGSQLAGVSGAVEKAHQDARTIWICHRSTKPVHDLEVGSISRHALTVQ